MSGRGGRKAVVIELSENERSELQRLVRTHSTPQKTALRCKIVLASAEGHRNVEIAKKLGCNAVTVGKWRNRFAEQRMFGLCDAPRLGRERSVTDDIVEKILKKTLLETPADATHWSTRSMAAAVGTSRFTVRRIWRGFNLKPHLTETFTLSNDPYSADKVHDII